MRTELVTIPTDTLPLDGAFYEPDGGATAGAVLLFHGNTMNFYIGAPRFLPPALTVLGFACLAFNRRGHDILSIRDSRAAEGAAFQTTAEGIADNRYAARWIADRGFPNPLVIGHSNGGMLAFSMSPTTRKPRLWSCCQHIPVERSKSRTQAAPG
jgi:pimeloyl-ACP methyl ester carboxylesterase